jgi:sec-independent protein translocase protein TatB
MFNIGSGEMMVILIAALVLLGPERLPELARGVGKFLREFRRQTDEVRGVMEREFYKMDQEVRSVAEHDLYAPPAALPSPAPATVLPSDGAVARGTVTQDAKAAPSERPVEPAGTPKEE